MAKYKTTVTHLEMMPPFLPAAPDVGWPDGLSFAREMDISVAAYRALYDDVGRQWHWVNRRVLTDRQLSAIIHHPATEIFTLNARDRAIGFVELNFKLFPQVEIVFVGLVEDVIGRGLGSTMLQRVISYIYARAQPHHHPDLHAGPPLCPAALSAFRLQACWPQTGDNY